MKQLLVLDLLMLAAAIDSHADPAANKVRSALDIQRSSPILHGAYQEPPRNDPIVSAFSKGLARETQTCFLRHLFANCFPWRLQCVRSGPNEPRDVRPKPLRIEIIMHSCAPSRELGPLLVALRP